MNLKQKEARIGAYGLTYRKLDIETAVLQFERDLDYHLKECLPKNKHLYEIVLKEFREAFGDWTKKAK